MRRSKDPHRFGRGGQSLVTLAVIGLLLAAGCLPLPTSSDRSSSAKAPTTPPIQRLVIYIPATPASVPIMLAAQQMENAEVTIFANHAQANAQFLRGDVDILVTGLSVGVDLFKNGAPVQVIDSYVAGMTYLVTYDGSVTSFTDLKGREIYIPFEGSPIEETTRFFVERAGLVWKTDVMPVYAPFASSVELLKQGRATAVALPEPFASLVEQVPNLTMALSYRELWDAATGTNTGYPQVTPFVTRDWAATHPDVIAQFNAAVAAALQTIQQDPSAAVAQTQAALGLPEAVLHAALRRTDFAFLSDDTLAREIQGYYRTIGKPLDETFDAFFYRSPQ